MAAAVAIQKLQGPEEKPNLSDGGKLFPAGLVAARTFVDVDEMAAAVKKWNHEGVQLAPGEFRGELLLAHTAGMQIHRARLSPAILIRGSAVPWAVVFGVQIGGARRSSWRGETLSPTEIATLDGTDEIDFRTTGPTELLVVSIERGLLEHYVAALGADSVSPHVRNCRLALASRSESQPVTHRWIELTEQARQMAQRLADIGIARQLEARVMEALLVNSHPAAREPSMAERRVMASRAAKHMVEHRDMPMTIADICNAVGAAERTLHLGFREIFGTTPKKFLKVLRLNSARRDLLHPATGTTVTEVALRWGFFHFARFAGDYLELFAESPSDTLRSARGARTPARRSCAATRAAS